MEYISAVGRKVKNLKANFKKSSKVGYEANQPRTPALYKQVYCLWKVAVTKKLIVCSRENAMSNLQKIE